MTDTSTPTAAAKASGAQGPSALPRLVDRLCTLARREDTVSLDDLTREIGAQGHAPLLLIVAVLLVLPTGMIPGVGGALGVLAAIIGLQMLLGRRGVWIPGFMGRREISGDRIERLAQKIKPMAEWFRRNLDQRWKPLAESRVSISLIALFLILTGGSMVVLGAIPIAAPLMGLPIMFFAFGILARDGVVVAMGYVLVTLAASAGIWMMPIGAS